MMKLYPVEKGNHVNNNSGPNSSDKRASGLHSIGSRSDSRKWSFNSVTTSRASIKDTNPFAEKSFTVTSSTKSRASSIIASSQFKSLKDVHKYLQTTDTTPLSSWEVERVCCQIVEFMVLDEENSSVQSRGAWALGRLSKLDSSDEESISTTKGVGALLTAMENFPEDAELQREACIALEALTSWEQNQAVILARRGQVDVVYSAMESFSDDFDLQIAALGTLYHLSCHPDSVEDAIAKDLAYAIPIILDLLKENRNHVKIYDKGCVTLSKLTEDNSASQLLFCHDGYLGIRVAVDALSNKTFSSHTNIQLSSMMILQHVASNPSLECKGRIIIHGGLERILETLKLHNAVVTRNRGKSSLSMQIMASALQTLANISDSKTKDHDRTRQQMGKAVPILLQVLKSRPEASQIQVTGYAALKNLADIHANLVTHNQGIAIIMRSMEAQINNPAVQKQTCQTLAKLFSKRQREASTTNNILSGNKNPNAAESLDLVLAIADENGIDTLFKAIRMHQPRRPVQEAAVEALYYLSCQRDLTARQKQQLCEEVNVVVALKSIGNFIESAAICEWGCGLVLNMSFFAPLLQDGMASVGGIRIVLSAMRRHGLNPRIQEHGSGILSGLLLDSRTHVEFLDQEGISTVLAAMVVHPYKPGIQAFGCDVLLSIARANKKLVLDVDAKQVASNALIRHKRHRGVQNRATSLLKVLN